MITLGRHCLALLFFAGLDLVYAFSLYSPDDESRRGTFLTWIASVAPLWAWAALWAAVGVTCLAYAFRPRNRTGFAVAIFLKVLWALVCVGGWLAGGADRGYVSAAIWLVAAGMVWVISRPEGWKGLTWTPRWLSPPGR